MKERKEADGVGEDVASNNVLAEEEEPEKSLKKNARASYCKMMHTLCVQNASFAFSECLC